MAGITLAQAEAQLALYVAAEAKILAGQSYRIGDRELTRADLADVQAGIATWDARCRQLDPSAGRPRVGFGVPG